MQDSSYGGYTSPASPVTLNLAVTPLGGSATNYNGSSCTGNGTGTSGSCNVTFSALPGATIFSGSLLEAGNVVARFSHVVNVQPSTSNSVNFTASPVVSSVSLALAVPSVNAGVQSDTLLTVNAKDANSNTIAGNTQYVDANGNPVSFSLNVTNNQAGGRGTVQIKGPVRVSAPNQAPIYAHTDGNWLQSSTISVVSSNGTIPSTSITLTTIPTAYELISGLTNPYAITTGSDGALWFTVNNSNQIGRLTTAGSLSLFAASTNPNGIVTGSDGNLWIVKPGSNAIQRRSPSGVSVTFSSGVTAPNDIVNGPDGALWYTARLTNNIGRITSTGIVTTLASSGTVKPTELTFGPDGNLWYTDQNALRVSRVTQTGLVTNYSPTCSGTLRTWGITASADGNIWFTERDGNCIGRITPSGTLTEFGTGNGLSPGASPVKIIKGPDGALWFGEDAGNKIGRVTTSGVITEYGNGISSGASPQGLTLGPDGNIWFTEWSGGRVGKFVL